MLLKTASLPPEVLHIILNKGTERPFTGEYDQFDHAGTYLCRQCGLALFRSETKFHSGCGWPSFDHQIPEAIIEQPDADGKRTEVVCARCHAHLGHVFHGEGFTAKNTRHCINSVSLDFVSDQSVKDTEEAILAGGCFWGIEHYLKKLPGVLKTEVGYTGGHVDHPSYEEVCKGNTGHSEAVRVLYDPEKISYESVVRYFFEIHNPTQIDGQGPDIGEQYKSKIFYYNEEQKKVAESLIKMLKEKGEFVVTQLLPVTIFWRAEDYHQNYYEKNGKEPYCHTYKRF